jgi:hypothetical protein
MSAARPAFGIAAGTENKDGKQKSPASPGFFV